MYCLVFSSFSSKEHKYTYDYTQVICFPSYITKVLTLKRTCGKTALSANVVIHLTCALNRNSFNPMRGGGQKRQKKRFNNFKN